MSFREIETHKRNEHAQVLEEMQRANQHFGRKLLAIIGPAMAVMFVALITPLAVFGVHAPGWYIVFILSGWLASLPAGWRYARKKTQAEFEVLGNLLYLCRICEVRVPVKDIRTHLGEQHPPELRYMRISAYVVFGSLVGIVAALFLYISATFLNLLPSVSSDILGAVFYGALSVWVALIFAWGVLVDPRHKAKARAAWQTSHLATRIDLR